MTNYKPLQSVLTDDEERAFHSALNFLRKREIVLSYTIKDAAPVLGSGDEPPAPALDRFLSLRPELPRLFDYSHEYENGRYDADAGAYLYDLEIRYDDENSNFPEIFCACIQDRELYKEFFRSLVYKDAEYNFREFVKPCTLQEWRALNCEKTSVCDFDVAIDQENGVVYYHNEDWK